MSGIRFSGMASGMDTENIIKQMMEIERMRVTKVEKEKTKMEWKKDVWKEMNTKIYDFYKNEVFDLKSSGSFAKKEATVSDSDAMSVTAGTAAVRGTHSIKITELAKGSFLTSGSVNEIFEAKEAGVGADTSDGKITLSVGSTEPGVDITIEKGDTAASIITKINNSGLDVKASYDSTYDKIFLSTTRTGADSTIQFSGIDSGIEAEFMGELGFIVSDPLPIPAPDPIPAPAPGVGIGPYEIRGSMGQDAEFTYNGASLKSDSNEVSVNGLDITLKQAVTDPVTAPDTIINVTQDTDAIYNKVKDFVLKYNELVLDINGKVNADSARKYDPLTSEEKEAMSDDDVKLWEKKIKDSLLRRDDVLTGLASSMRGILVSSSGLEVETAGMDYKYLSDLGIVTGSYTERGLLHIQGDEDDSLYADKTNKLKEAIEKDPEKVADFLNAMGTELYDTMQKKMKSTTLSSAFTFYNDKNMDEKVKAYESKIADLEERMAAVEERYYKQFTAMEKMIQQMNNQSSSLMGMMGGGQ